MCITQEAFSCMQQNIQLKMAYSLRKTLSHVTRSLEIAQFQSGLHQQVDDASRLFPSFFLLFSANQFVLGSEVFIFMVVSRGCKRPAIGPGITPRKENLLEISSCVTFFLSKEIFLRSHSTDITLLSHWSNMKKEMGLPLLRQTHQVPSLRLMLGPFSLKSWAYTGEFILGHKQCLLGVWKWQS